MMFCLYIVFFFFFNDTATTEIYTLSLHDALPILCSLHGRGRSCKDSQCTESQHKIGKHTSELQSPCNLVCRLLLEKKKKKKTNTNTLYTLNIPYYLMNKT